MQNELNQLATQLAGLFARTGTIPGPTANLGIGDGLGTLIVPNGQPGEVYLHDPLTNQQHYAYMDPGSPLVLLQDGHPEIEDIEVVTGYKMGSKTLTILGVNTLAGREAAGTMTPWQEFVQKGYWATPDQITLFRPRPTDTPSTSIKIDIGLALLQPSTSTLYVIASLTLPLADQIAALASGEHQLVLPYVSKTTLTAGVLEQTAVSSAAAVGTTDSHNEFVDTDVQLFTGITSDMQLTVPLELYYGQTAITEAAFYRTWDARWAGLSSGSGGSGVDAVKRIAVNRKGYSIVDRTGHMVMTR